MGNSYSSWRITLFVLSIVLAEDLGAVICRPMVSNGMGSIAGLNMCIADAELSTEDYIIDLGGGIYTYDTDSGSGYALPTIESEHGMLSIINGAIERSRTATTDFGIFNVESGAYLTLFNITIENGSVSSTLGSAINNAGTLSLEDCLLQNNSATGRDSYNNGTIYNSGTIDSMVNCIFVNNSVNVTNTDGIASINGGAINNNSIINEINQCTFAYNSTICTNTGLECKPQGGGIYNNGTIGSIINSVFNANSSTGTGSEAFGGGIYNDFDGNITLSNSTFYGNQVTENGGGIYNDEEAIISINNCTISGNTANNGGGIYNDGTISSLYSNIVAYNTSTDNFDITNNGTISTTNEGFNLIGAASGTDIMDGVNGDIVIGYLTDPHLGPLQYNGGPTYTMALFPQSFAINNGYNPDSLLYDQRGSSFQRVVRSRPDIGAFELQNF